MKAGAVVRDSLQLSMLGSPAESININPALSDIHSFNFYSSGKSTPKKENSISFESLESTRVKAMLSINNAAGATNHLAFADANAALSDLYLKNLAAIKIIGKGTQCIEKLVNLQ